MIYLPQHFETETLNLDCLIVSLELKFFKMSDNGFLRFQEPCDNVTLFISPSDVTSLSWKINAIDFILPYSLADTQMFLS